MLTYILVYKIIYLHNNNIEGSVTATILPESFTGSPRYLHKKCPDAMSLVGKFGKLHLFITITKILIGLRSYKCYNQDKLHMTGQKLPTEFSKRN